MVVAAAAATCSQYLLPTFLSPACGHALLRPLLLQSLSLACMCMWSPRTWRACGTLRKSEERRRSWLPGEDKYHFHSFSDRNNSVKIIGMLGRSGSHLFCRCLCGCCSRWVLPFVVFFLCRGVLGKTAQTRGSFLCDKKRRMLLVVRASSFRRTGTACGFFWCINEVNTQK